MTEAEIRHRLGNGALLREHPGVFRVQVMWQAVIVRDGLTIWWEPFRSEEEA